MKKLNIIIPVAGVGRRMRSYGPKALIYLHGKTLIERQLYILRQLYPEANFTVVVGFAADKITKVLDKNIRVVENDSYERTNVAYSIALALQHINNNYPVLIVYGDLVFNFATFKDLHLDRSAAIIDTQGRFNKGEVGATIVNSEISQFAYSLPIKWGQIVYLEGKDLFLFKDYIQHKNRVNYFGFEILNGVLNNDGHIHAIEPNHMQIAEIDTSKDIERARKIAL
jgi:NDP-sugar pyrophosphorylase family protein